MPVHPLGLAVSNPLRYAFDRWDMFSRKHGKKLNDYFMHEGLHHQAPRP